MRDRELESDGRDEFAAIYQKYYDRVFRYVCRRIPDVQTAEDIVQDTFFIAYMKKPDFLGSARPLAWLLRTAGNKIMERWRYMRRRGAESLEEVEPGLGQEELRYEMAELEQTALKTLGRDEWRLVKKCYLYGVTVSELAEAEGVSEGSMRVRLWRLVKKLQKN